MKTDLKVKIKNFSGEEKEFNFVALTRKNAMNVFHDSISAILSAIAEINEDSKDVSVFKALKAIDFDMFWSLAEKLLKHVIINGQEITDINETDYFDDNPEEMYLAVYHAIRLNYPKVFSKVQRALKGSIPLDLMEKIEDKK